MTLGQIVLIAYAALMLVGGLIGWKTAGSTASLIAGAASAVVLVAAWLLSRSAPAAGYWVGAVTALALCFVFVMRLAKTGKFMPSGMTLALSLVALVLLVRSALRG